MTAARTSLAALCGLMLVTPFAFAQGRKSSGNTVVITYTYRTYGGS